MVDFEVPNAKRGCTGAQSVLVYSYRCGCDKWLLEDGCCEGHDICCDDHYQRTHRWLCGEVGLPHMHKMLLTPDQVASCRRRGEIRDRIDDEEDDDSSCTTTVSWKDDNDSDDDPEETPRKCDFCDRRPPDQGSTCDRCDRSNLRACQCCLHFYIHFNCPKLCGNCRSSAVY